MSIKKILILPHLKINNANAWSSPYSAGFPSVSAFGGAVHALQRKLNTQGFERLELTGFGVISHKFGMRTWREGGFGDLSLIASANPLDKNGDRPSFVPEIKCRMEISLVCELKGCNRESEEALAEAVQSILKSELRIAAGDLVGARTPVVLAVSDENQDFSRNVVRKLMPGYALIERRDLMIKSMEQGRDALESLLEYLTVTATPDLDGGETERKRKEPGWLVPISTGYAAISELGTAVNQRDALTPHRFAESLVTLGEFKMLHRIKDINSLLWQGIYDEEHGLYCFKQNAAEEEEDNDDEFDMTSI